jgi:tetratricopeptide (TPR) repeat protein
MPGKSLKYIKKALELEKDAPSLYLNLANTYLILGDTPRALETYISAVSHNPNFGDLFRESDFFNRVTLEECPGNIIPDVYKNGVK